MKRSFPFPSQQCNKRFRGETEDIVLSSSAPPNSTRTGEFLLQLITESTITSNCTSEVLEQGKKLIPQVSNLLLCNTHRSLIHPVVRLSGVVLSRYNVSILLRQEYKEDNCLSSVVIHEVNCTCDHPRVNKQFCPHTVAILSTIFTKGSRCVEFHQQIATQIKSYSKEVLAKCILELLTERPDVAPIVKSLLDPDNVHLRTSSMANKVVSSGNRKACVAVSNVLQELEVDPHVIAQSVAEGFQKFIKGLKYLCSSSCDCACHEDMNDNVNCSCVEGQGDYSLVQSSVNMWVCRMEEFLGNNQQGASSNALVIAEALVREYSTQVEKLFDNDAKESQFPEQVYDVVEKYHKEHFIRNGKELCWRFALLIVRRDVYHEIRSLVGKAMSVWVGQVSTDLSKLLVQIQAAAFDETQGIDDSYIKNPLITAARASELNRVQDMEALQEYWRITRLPLTPARILQLNIGFHELF